MIKKSKKSNRSAFKLETLEQRQLLATIVAGSGTEVNSDVTLANGNTYDQILLTGSEITVSADAGQVTRVDFVDADGDIVRAEISGAGQLTVSLADFAAAKAPGEYNTTTEYVSGLASLRVTGSDETTNVAIYSLGTANVTGGATNSLFEGGKDGGSNQANIAKLVIESDGGVLGNAFGGIYAGNAVFGDDAGAVGIIAPDVQFMGPIVIGGIETAGNATAVLQIGQFSTNKTVTLAGTILEGEEVDNKNVTGVVSGSGQTSMGEIIETQTFDDTVFKNAVANLSVTYTSGYETVTINDDNFDDFTGKYLNEVIIEEGFSGTFEALLIGKVTVQGDLEATITSSLLSIGDVDIEGTITATGHIDANTSLGNVVVGDDLATDTVYVGTIISAGGNIGNVTFEGDVDINDPDVVLVASTGGNIGTITGGKLEGDDADTALFDADGNIGNIEFTGDIAVGMIAAGGKIGNITGADVTIGDLGAGGVIGSITSTDGDLELGDVDADAIGAIKADEDLVIGGLDTKTAAADGSIGALEAGKTISINGAISSDKNIGAIKAADGITVDALVKADGSIGDISVTGSEKILDFGAAGAFDAGTTIGKVTVASGSITSANTGTEFTANKIGDVSVTGHEDTVTLLTDVTFVAEGAGATIGNIVLDATENSAGVIAANMALGSGSGFSSTGSVGSITITGNEDGSLLGANTDVLFFRAGSANMLDADVDAAADGAVSIGAVNITANLAGLGSGAGTGLYILSGIEATADGVFVSGVGTAVQTPTKSADVNGSIGSVTITDLAGSGVSGFSSNALASDVFAGGSLIAANSIGALEIEAGESVSKSATGTGRKGAINTTDDAVLDEGDLYIVVV